MPKSKQFLNGFTKKELNAISGLSLPMIDYLGRHGYLCPTYCDETSGQSHRDRGRVRYYSYRDLVVAKVVQKLRDGGVHLSKLKSSIQYLNQDKEWREETTSRQERIRWLVYDGRKVRLKRQDGFLDELKTNGQRSFSFIVGLEGTQAEVLKQISAPKKRLFSMENKAMQLEKPQRNRMRSSS